MPCKCDACQAGRSSSETLCFLAGCFDVVQQSGVCHDHYENGFAYDRTEPVDSEGMKL